MMLNMLIRNRCKQSGFSLMAAVFLLLLLSILAIVLLSTVSARARTTALNLDASRAFYAAQSGIDIAAANAVIGGCGSVPATLTIETFAVNLTCASTAVNEAGNNYQIFQLVATAAKGSMAQSTFVSRRLRVSLSEVP